MNARRLILTAMASLCALSGTLVLGVSAQAKEVRVLSSSFGGPGSGDGEFDLIDGANDIAVNDRTHDVYVLDEQNHRIEEFTSTGEYIRQFDGSAAPTGALGSPANGIAIDNSGNPLDASAGDIYVSDERYNVVYKFNEEGVYLGQLTAGASSYAEVHLEDVAVAPSGVVLVEYRYPGKNPVIDSFSDALVNEYVSSRHVEKAIGKGLAVDSEGRVYFGQQGRGFVRVMGSSTEEEEIGEGWSETGEAIDLAVDTSDNEVYDFNGGRVAKPSVAIFGENGLVIEQFGSEYFTLQPEYAGGGIAVDSSTHTVYVAEVVSEHVFIFNEVVVPDVSTGEEPTNLEQEGSATLEGTVDPDGLPVTSCEFEYGTTPAYGKVAPCESSPGSGSSAVVVRADVSGLTPLTDYHYRLVAANANGSNAGSDRSFIAPAHPTLESESVTNIVSGGATLEAQVNPGAADTTYRFEYGPTASYGTTLPVPDGDAGSGTVETSISVNPQNLLPDTTYHFRVVVSNVVQQEVAGPDLEFTTQPAGTAFELPDGRLWELVSPPIKANAGILSGFDAGSTIQAAEGGGAIAYVADGPTTDPAGNRSPEITQLLSRRGPGGWETQDLATPHTAGSFIQIGHEQEYLLFSSNLSLGLVEPPGHTALGTLPEGSERTPYLRREPGGEYEPLLTPANTPPGAEYGKQNDAQGADFEGGSPDLHDLILQSPEVPLLASGIAGSLYEWSAGQLQLVSVLPASEGRKVTHGLLGNDVGPLEGKVSRDAVSADGSRVIWSGEYKEKKHLYLREMGEGEEAEGETIRLDVLQGGEGGESHPQYQAANSEGTRVFFTDTARLTAGASKEGEDLYVFEVTSAPGEPLAGKVTDLTVDRNAGENAAVQGSVIGASENGAAVYFVADGVLGDGGERGAKSGTCAGRAPQATCNLYVARYDEATGTWMAPRFIATLSEEDSQDWAEGGHDLAQLTARVSPNGRYLAFMSELSLTGYNNSDANSGAPDEEVFLYDAEADGGAGRLVCASCDPTGARPTGMLVSKVFPGALVDPNKNWAGRWLAGNVPGWNVLNISSASGYQPRYLSSSGRLFFDSADALVPADVNGKENVYEYEPLGVGSCSSTRETSDMVFSEGLGGCVGLLSSGTSTEESVFLDASEGGGEVFFMTTSRLVAQDIDNAYDVYDAHECTGASPCPAPVAVLPPACTTAEACRAAPTPQPAIFGAPSSATFSGAGNIVPQASTPAVAKRSLTRAQKLASALKACRKKAKRKRASCESQAQKKYGASRSRAKRKAQSKQAGAKQKSSSTRTRR